MGVGEAWVSGEQRALRNAEEWAEMRRGWAVSVRVGTKGDQRYLPAHTLAVIPRLSCLCMLR